MREALQGLNLQKAAADLQEHSHTFTRLANTADCDGTGACVKPRSPVQNGNYSVAFPKRNNV